MQSLKKVIFVTGNANKLAEVQKILAPYVEVESHKADIPELQGEPEEITKEKAKYAAKQIKPPFIIEDTCLCFNALQGLPGPYIKWFLEKLGHEGLNKLLAGYEDKSAYAQCIFAYVESETSEPKLFIGKCPGKIVPARGDHHFGWDPVFEPDGFNQTFAEMDKEIKNTISHRGKALQEMVKFFEEKNIQ